MTDTDRDAGGLPPGWPDIATLERLANELFTAPPSTASPADVPSTFTPPSPADSRPSSLASAVPSDVAPSHFAPLHLAPSHLPVAPSHPAPPHLPSVPPHLSFLPTAHADHFQLPALPLRVPAFEPIDVHARPAATGATLDVPLIRRDFPILEERINGRPLVWLDNAATTQKPRAVVERLAYFYAHENSNVHRAAHQMAARATDAYEAAREKVRAFLNATSTNEIVFVRGATEAINLVAHAWGRQHIGRGHEIVVSWLEHHANIVPWQRLADETGAVLKVIPVDETGQIRLDAYGALLGPKTKIVAFTQVSNALGTITPAREMIAMAHAVGARVLLDGAQAVSHMRVDVQALDADWYVFSGHKVFAPTGIGALYGRESLLNETQPWQSGGSMIKDVTFERTIYQQAPARFEAGTGNIADAVGLGAAIDYVTRIGLDAIAAYEHELLAYATRLLGGIRGLTIVGTAPEKAGVLSFVLAGHRPEDVGAALDREGIAVRSGHHCAQPILRRFGHETTVRASLAFYNTCADIDALVAVVTRLSSRRA